MRAELEENEKLMAELTEQLKKLEDEAGEIMKACHEAEVAACHLRYSYQNILNLLGECFSLRGHP